MILRLFLFDRTGNGGWWNTSFCGPLESIYFRDNSRKIVFLSYFLRTKQTDNLRGNSSTVPDYFGFCKCWSWPLTVDRTRISCRLLCWDLRLLAVEAKHSIWPLMVVSKPVLASSVGDWPEKHLIDRSIQVLFWPCPRSQSSASSRSVRVANGPFYL